jgi:transketolase
LNGSEQMKNKTFKFAPTSLRKTILKMAFSGATVHIGCAFSIVEILAVLYRQHLDLGDGTPGAAERDYLVLSKGHGVMAQYACMHELTWLRDADIEGYFSDGSLLKGLSDAHVPGLEVTSGTLGHGLSVGVGLALSAKLAKNNKRCFAIIGDGEMNEGAIWEALLFAAHFKLDNLMVIVDENRFQAMGTTEEVMNLGNIKHKLDAFGFDCLDVNGHDEQALDAGFSSLMANKNGRPKAIVAATVKGKGVSFMENNNSWHYTRLNAETYEAALTELDA